MMSNFAILALAAAAAAMPAPQAGSGAGIVPPQNKEFGLIFKIDGSFVSINAFNNGSATELVLAGERLAAYPGTPAYLNQTTPGQLGALNLDIDGEVYGLSAPKVGNNYGFTSNILAIKDYQEFEWNINNDTVNHKLEAGLNGFYACKDTVNGVELDVLRWGDANQDLTAPEGCVLTSVHLNYNVPGGAVPATSS